MSCKELDEKFLKTVAILYVEDDADTREQLGQFLKRRAGRLISAVNGVDGLEKFTRLKPQIVVTDILMPEMDGLDMSSKIRDLDKSVPIIVTTAFEQTDYLLRSIDIGVDKYVVKPVNADRLHGALLDCAHRLRAEDLLRQQHRLETEALRSKHLEALHVLAGGMAHDFNNLLQALLGFVYLAKAEARPGSKVQEYLEMADNCSVQARDLGERLLLVARAEKNVRHDTSLSSLVQAVVTDMLNRTAISVEFDIPDNLPDVTCDDSQMLEVLTNLTHNSLEAMPAGGRIRISASSGRFSGDDAMSLPEGDYLQVTFADTGVGIAPEHLPKIFDPYFSTRDIGSQKGMGLGLALCDTIIRNHGGMIRAESPPGSGAVFHIWLPVTAKM